MYQHRSLISELEDAVRRGSQEKRAVTLKRVTDLFLGENERLNEEQIQVFDEVLGHLITRMESTALIDLSERLAPINNAPCKVVHTLARDDEIAIAGPVLSLSDRLTTPDLIEIAMAKGQSHLLAISKRSSLSESLTDTLIERGDQQVIRKLAENAGARFSERAYAHLLDQPKADERDDIREVLASISDDVIENEEVDQDFAAAQRLIQLVRENGELNQVALLEFAKSRKYAATVTALATLCSAPIDMIKQMLNDGRNEPLLVPCKAAEISWPTLRALLQDDLLGRVATDDELNKLKSDYARLSPSTAKKLLEFWCEHHMPQKS